MANGIISGPPQVDFYKAFSGIGDTLQNNTKLQQQQQLNDARKAAFSDFSALDPTSPDYGKQALTIAQRLGSSGDQDGALKFITLAGTAADRQRQAARDQADDKYRSASLAIQKQNADRLNATPLDTAQQRSEAARQYGLDPMSPAGLAFVLTGKLPDSVANGGTPEVGLSPAYGTGPDGKPAAVQFSKTGKAVMTQLPEGFSLSREPIKIDQGTSIVLIDPITRQQIGVLPKDLRGAEREKGIGEAQGKAVASAPADIQAGQSALDLLDKIEKSPNIDRGTGVSSIFNRVPGTSGFDFANIVEQAKSGAFLQAIQQMRGLGSLSNAEGGAATAAITRMNTASSKEAFLDALTDYRKIVAQGMQRARARLSNPSATDPQSSSTQQMQEGVTATNPQTGQRAIFKNGKWEPLS